MKYEVTLKITVDAENSAEALLKAIDQRTQASDYDATVKEASGQIVIFD